MSFYVLSNSRSACNGICVFKPTEESADVEENGVYIGKTMTYRMPFALNPEKLMNPHVAVLGMTGSGKTYFIKGYITRMRLQMGTSLLVVDWNGEYDEVISYLEGKIIRLMPGDCVERSVLSEEVVSINLSEVKDDKQRKLIVADITDLVIKQLHDMKIDDKKKRLFLLDEAWKMLGETSKLGQLFREGRKYGVGVIVSTQLLNDINNEILANAATILIFKMQNAQDYALLVDSGLVPANFMSTLSELDVGSCMIRLAHKGSENGHTNIFIKRVSGVSISVYELRGDRMQIKISRARFLEIAELVISNPESRNKLVAFMEANERSLDLGTLIWSLRKNGSDRVDVVAFLRMIGFDDVSIIKAYEARKAVIIEV